MSKYISIDEGEDPYERVKDSDVDVGDIITVGSANQLGYKYYKVINKLGSKGLSFSGTMDETFEPTYNFASKYNMGGKMRKRKGTKRRGTKRRGTKRRQ